MRRRSFMLALPASALASAAANAAPTVYPGVYPGDRISGASFAGRSAVWGTHGAAATAHPMATMIAIDTLRRGGSAVDAAIAANAALGFLEPTANGVGGDAFVMLWDPKLKTVVGLNGSGRSPRGLSAATVQARARDGHIPSYGAVSVSVPGTVDAWWTLHQRYGKLPWAEVLEPAAALAEQGAPVPQTIAWYMDGNMKRFTAPGAGVEEVENALKTYAPKGHTPREGEVFRNPDLARTLRLIARGGRDAFYQGEIAEIIDRYFKRIGGWMTKADLAAHHSEWTQPLVSNYRGVHVWGLAPNTQGLSTLQMLNVMEQFDLKSMGFQSAASLHHQAEAKRLAFEDRARWFADPDFSKTPIEQLTSKDYAKQRAKLIRPDRVMDRVFPGDAPSKGDTTYFTTADADGMMVSFIQSNYRGMGSGLVADGLGFMFQDRGELFDVKPGRPNSYAPGKRPFHTIIPGFATKGDQPWLSFGVMGGDMQPQGQAQIIANMVDYGLGVQEAGDSPRWHHEGSSEPTGEPAEGVGVLHLETGVPEATRKALADMGWKLGPSDGGFGGYQAILKGPEAYGAASEMRKDGLALTY
ncbi:gamma-glutamyltransferase [Caulobacter sp. 17J80-11]|uniref:gamma-glutamyltransferase n=1 Tax=Caulobacter sp. 17J80-11 TaxID=2763502 RepID=UPI0016535685|nr:gamma-glutamyltransferase [Caulobacter sp. 17J80-11]MBC6981049.1 gamma-glutamyltransferase [Caulobacter sp. 17J80-11]